MSANQLPHPSAQQHLEGTLAVQVRSLQHLAETLLIHQDTRSVIKVVRYGLNIQCFPDAHAVELVERQIARQRERRENEGSPAD